AVSGAGGVTLAAGSDMTVSMAAARVGRARRRSFTAGTLPCPAVQIEGMPLWLAETNAWFVAPAGPGGECVLIDAPPDPRAILGRLAERELRLVALLSTHGHVDHVGGIGSVVHAQDHDVPVHIHDNDRHML